MSNYFILLDLNLNWQRLVNINSVQLGKIALSDHKINRIFRRDRTFYRTTKIAIALSTGQQNFPSQLPRRVKIYSVKFGKL
ncbi:MAG: hypothetical protein RIM23_29530 [Coleofasciculus sp. G3-WIS-01]|uniref:hypothetical protein n=1 Tax=Coleofasciculus sp. G3-WIS-01 TaxID=3069528 RepID=UPI0032F8B22E